MMRTAGIYTLLILGALAAAYPFLWMVGTSLETLQESIEPGLSPWPQSWEWSNYAETFRAAPFGRYFLNTAVVALIVTTSVLVTSLMAGYAFARLEFPGKRVLFFIVLSTMLIPFETVLIPNFMIISSLNWYNTYAALIVPWCANAFSIFLIRQALLALPQDYFDAARMDGCGHIRTLFFIAAPLIKPALAATAIFAFLASYNALLWPLVVTSSDSMRVVQVGLTLFSGDAGVRTNLLMAASVIVIVPTVAIYFAAQRHFMASISNSGIKG